MTSNFWQHCAISSLEIIKKTFWNLWFFFYKNKACFNCETYKHKVLLYRLKLYGLYLLAVKTLCRKVIKSSPRIGQPSVTQFHFLSLLCLSVNLNFWFRHRNDTRLLEIIVKPFLTIQSNIWPIPFIYWI